MKRSGESVLAFAILLGFGVLAAPAFAQQDGGRSTDQHLEFGVHGGYVFSARVNLRATCTDITASGSGCATGEGLPFATKAGGGLSVNSGTDFGARIGLDVTPRLQVEFTWDHSNTRLAFRDEADRIATITAETSSEEGNTIVNSGRAQGFLNIYQFNVNYHLRKTGRLVPYFGGGLGWINFKNPPVFIDAEPPTEDTTVVRLASTNSFAFNLGAGVKLHATPHIGFRLEARQLFSFYRATHNIRTFMNDPATGLPSGTLSDFDANNNTRQRSIFTHLAMTAGIFLRF